MLHRDIAPGEQHRVQQWEVANAAARTALSVIATDIGKICRQTDNNSFWILQNNTGPVWGALILGIDPNTVSVIASAAGVLTIDCGLGDYYTLQLAENINTINFTNLPGAGKAASKFIRITQGPGTAYTVSWPASFRWEGAAPVVSTAIGSVDLLALTTFDNGTKWDTTLSKGRV